MTWDSVRSPEITNNSADYINSYVRNSLLFICPIPTNYDSSKTENSTILVIIQCKLLHME